MEEEDVQIDYYEILGVAREATRQEIKDAYRAKTKLHHPDRGGDPDMFVCINDAYTVLSDPDARKYYDETGSTDQFNPQKFMLSVIHTMGALFDKMLDVAIKTNINLDMDSDFIDSFRSAGMSIRTEYLKRLIELQKTIKELRKMEKRIKRKGEDKNIFADHINKRIREILPKKKECDDAIKVWDRIFEELDNYEDGNSFIRSMQAAAYPGEATTSSSSSSSFLNWRGYSRQS